MSYPWPNGAQAAVSLSLDFDGESPHLWRSRNDPDQAIGELEQRRYGPRRGIENLLAMMDNLGLRTTVFVPGWIADRYPHRVAEVAERGHELALHGWCHEPPSTLDRDGMLRTLARAAETIESIAGIRPRGYRSPSWDMNEDIIGVLGELGLDYDSSLMGDDRPYLVDGLVEVPVDWATDDAPYYRYVKADPRPPATTSVVQAGWAAEIAGAKKHGSLALFTVHPWLSGRPARVDALEALFAEVVADEQLCSPIVSELADHHRILQAASATEDATPPKPALVEVNLDGLRRPSLD